MRRLCWPLLAVVAACSERSVERPPPLARDVAAADVGAMPAPRPPSAPGPACVASAAVELFASPRAARAGKPLRLVAVAGKPAEGTLTVTGPDGAPVATTAERHGGPPYWWFAEVAAPTAGTYRVALEPAAAPAAPATGGAASAGPSATRACREVRVEADPAVEPERAWGAAWGVRAAWSRAFEDLYSAWIEKLFDAPLAEQPSWHALHEVLHDPKRNFLFDHLGLDEDGAGQAVSPDCADLPYFLRAYFAFKLGLPFGYSSCTRGGGGLPPECLRWHTNLEDPSRRTSEVDVFGDFLRVTLADAVHSGTARAPAAADNTDYYPVPLSAESLRPGTVYADPYGHVLLLAKRIAQTATEGGVLLAVDGQPDGTVSRRRFWRGNFLFDLDPSLGSPGWKRFRPVVLDERRRPRALTNREVAADPSYADYSMEQYANGASGFYDRMDDVLSPAPLDPMRAMRETLQALEEQVRGRVTSVQNGKAYLDRGGARIDMPEGPAIFETTGAWEDFSTPSRDLRLLIAIDIARGFPEYVARRPERYAMPAGKGVAEVRGELTTALAQELAARSVTYERSDGSAFVLPLAQVVDRRDDLEMAYDPNDCVEVRWGAPAGSEEASTCRRRAPGSQLARMRKARPWFHERKRPPRP